jgi:hypothetical protein
MRVHVLPDFELTSAMFEAVHAKLIEIGAPMPEGGFTFERFIEARRWKRIPHALRRNTHFKVEQTFLGGAPYKRTIKLNVWYDRDIRVKGEAWPHNHPWWPVKAYPVLNGYEQDGYTLLNTELDDFGMQSFSMDNLRIQRGMQVRAGGVNVMEHNFFHEVTEVHKPGLTVSIMDCGPSVKNAWGYLDLENQRVGNFENFPVAPEHKAAMKKLNAHLIG